MEKRYAYLIIAHNKFKQLNYLVSLLDNKRNDIFILVDKKSEFNKENMADLNALVNDSRLFFVKRINIYWGDYSQIEGELSLFKKAFNKGPYYYYILLSGVDLPLISQTKIHLFFDNHPRKIFIAYGKKFNNNIVINRVKYNHISPKLFGRNKMWKIFRLFFNVLDRLYVKLQQVLGVNKVKKYNLNVDYASNWVILDNYTVKILLNNINWINRIFKHSLACDEVFIPTLINKYHLNKKVYISKRLDDNPNTVQGNLDYINWWDGSPYTWKNGDEGKLEKAIKLGHMFSRKFDLANSKQLKIFLEKEISEE